MIRLSLLLALCAPAACGESMPSLEEGEPLYDRLEGTGFDNGCESDSDCVVGGCSSEVCAAEAVASTCEVLELPQLGDCLCHAGECRWMD
ncbi:MAG: hypothetical protein R3B72_08755 [Polyangiaceae bacterium]